LRLTNPDQLFCRAFLTAPALPNLWVCARVVGNGVPGITPTLLGHKGTDQREMKP
jgi:hypothetical protein